MRMRTSTSRLGGWLTQDHHAFPSLLVALDSSNVLPFDFPPYDRIEIRSALGDRSPRTYVMTLRYVLDEYRNLQDLVSVSRRTMFPDAQLTYPSSRVSSFSAPSSKSLMATASSSHVSQADDPRRRTSYRWCPVSTPGECGECGPCDC